MFPLIQHSVREGWRTPRLNIGNHATTRIPRASQCSLGSTYLRLLSTTPPDTTVNRASGIIPVPGESSFGRMISVAVDGYVTLEGPGDANSVSTIQIGA